MFHKRLRLARKRKGLSMKALADKVTPKITAQAISKYETGRMMPSSAVLVGLAEALQVSLDFLMSAQVEALDGLEFRKHSATSARDRALAEAIVIDNLERYLAVEDILGIPPQIDGFDELATDHIASEDEIDAKADQLRDFWQLGTDPIPSMCALLEDHGIKVVEDDLPQRINGLACRVLRSGKPVADAVVVSTQTNVERKRFNLAHELAHRIIGATQNPEIRLEPAMNRFAGAFLIPRQHLLLEAGAHRRGLTYYEIILLKHTYGVSAAAMLMRLGQVGILRPTNVRHAFSTFARSWRTDEPDPIRGGHGFGAFEKPRRFERLVWHALGEELISPVRAAALLDQPLSTIEHRLSGPQSE